MKSKRFPQEPDAFFIVSSNRVKQLGFIIGKVSEKMSRCNPTNPLQLTEVFCDVTFKDYGKVANFLSDPAILENQRKVLAGFVGLQVMVLQLLVKAIRHL